MANPGISGVIVRCDGCQSANRIPFSRLAESGGRCGKCKATLPAPSTPIAVRSEAEFNDLIAQSPLPVLVDWWSPRCGPCLAMAPELDLVARRRARRLVVAKVDTLAHPALGARARIRAVPTLSVHRAGREVARTSGARPAAQIEAFVDTA